MPKFDFEAKSPAGKTVRGSVTAENEAEAKIRLQAEGFQPTKMSTTAGPKPKGGLKAGPGSVKAKDLQIFTRQMSTLINSGVHLVQSLELMANGTKSAALKKAINAIRDDVSRGKSLHQGMAAFPKIFDRLYMNMVKAGEEGGVLDVVMDRLAQYIEKAVKLRGKITGAMWYPAGIIVVAFIVIMAILTFVIPQFEELFRNSGQELPALTVMVIDFSNTLLEFWYIFITGFIATGFGLYFWHQSAVGRKQFDFLILKVPVFGQLVRFGALARFSRTFGTLMSAGVSITDALEISSNVVGNAVLEAVFVECKDSITQGRALTKPLLDSKEIPDMMAQMISVGEQTGSIDEMLGKVADFYEEEVDKVVGAVTSIIEPVLMVFLGGIIAVLVIAMYLPIFNLAGSVQS